MKLSYSEQACIIEIIDLLINYRKDPTEEGLFIPKQDREFTDTDIRELIEYYIEVHFETDSFKKKQKLYGQLKELFLTD